MFRNVVAIVSGGASGLGAATASYLVRHGARVVVADLPRARENFLKLKEESTTALHDDIVGTDRGGGGGALEFAAADVTNEDEITSALDMAEGIFGEHGACLYVYHPARRSEHSFRPPPLLRTPADLR